MKWTGYQGSEEVHIKRSFMICTDHPNIIRVIKSRRMRWAGNVASVRERRGA
jgi:hypothetical protein